MVVCSKKLRLFWNPYLAVSDKLLKVDKAGRWDKEIDTHGATTHKQISTKSIW